MQKLTLSLLIIAVSTAVYSIISTTQLAAQSANFSNIIPFATNVGRIGFFDQINGRIYIYDGDGKTCLFSGQIKELGKPLESLQNTSPTPQRTKKYNTKTIIDEKGEKTIILNNN